ncbi:hypothetical protein AB0939_29830 [Streptomyces sp. NPDC006990]|uniref:hypothetical protein n=1 Tax=Streptomyces sp. NPDC006990 TaxID=3154481 RepID=UPI003453EC0F
MAIQRHEAGAYIVLTLAAAGVGGMGLIAMLAALLDFLDQLSPAFGISVTIPAAAILRKGTRR